jgi:hypothetical protein
MIERTTFFSQVRRDLFAGRLTQAQVDGLTALLDEWEHQQLTDVRWLAYMLATAYHEVDKTMQPIKEYGGDKYFFQLYDIDGGRPAVARQLGNLQPGDGVRFAGRGLVQLTGRANYARMSALVTRPRFDIRLEEDPDAALRLDVAVAILFEGMTDACSHFGDFTGLALDDFFSANRNDPVGARRIVNGLDRAELIAGHHRKFLAAIDAASRAVAA